MRLAQVEDSGLPVVGLPDMDIAWRQPLMCRLTATVGRAKEQDWSTIMR